MGRDQETGSVQVRILPPPRYDEQDATAETQKRTTTARRMNVSRAQSPNPGNPRPGLYSTMANTATAAMYTDAKIARIAKTTVMVSKKQGSRPISTETGRNPAPVRRSYKGLHEI